MDRRGINSTGGGPVGAYPSRASDIAGSRATASEGEMPRFRSMRKIASDKEPTVRIGYAAITPRAIATERSPYHFAATRAADT